MLLWAGTPRRRVLVLAGIVLATGLNALLRGEWYVNEVSYLVGNLIEPVVMLPFLIRATAPRLRMERLVSVAWLTGGRWSRPLCPAPLSARLPSGRTTEAAPSPTGGPPRSRSRPVICSEFCSWHRCSCRRIRSSNCGRREPSPSR